MLTELCAEIRNYFIQGIDDIHAGEYTISGGEIQSLDFLQDGQYYRIVGSVFNDGVWIYNGSSPSDDPSLTLTDETFNGAIWAMRMPPAVIALSQEIDDWVEANKSAIDSPYTSESFEGYSYSKSSGSGEGTNGAGWHTHFASKLRRWRKLHEL